MSGFGATTTADEVLAGIDLSGQTVFVTGGVEAHRFGTDPPQPDADAVQAWLAAEELHPRFAMGRLA